MPDKKKHPNVKEMVNMYLRPCGFDGLWNPDGECACLIDNLAPCGEMSKKCEAGYKHKCHCGEHDYHIGREKRGRIKTTIRNPEHFNVGVWIDQGT